AFYRGALGAKRREVIADAAALLHGEGGFLQILENAFHRVGDFTHHEAVEERDIAPGTRACDDAASGEKAIAVHCLAEACGPMSAVLRLFGFSQCRGDTGPCIRDRAVKRRPVLRMEAVFHVPDLFGNRMHFVSFTRVAWCLAV